jgi:PAS domain S-box-containing protein
MFDAVDEPANLPSLRQRAVAKLKPGERNVHAQSSTSAAMAVLYQLASSPSTAADALALLHELQVHQVEIDMQHEEMRNSRNELEAALARKTALVDRAPVGHLCVDAASLLCEVNQTGTRLLGATSDELLGRSLGHFVAPTSVDTFETMMSRAREGLAAETCKLHLLSATGEAHDLYASAARGTAPGHVLLVFMPTA